MTETEATALVPEARRRIIRRSMRCELLGWIGLTPVLGMGAAFVSVRLHRQTLRDGGEHHPHAKIQTALALGAPLSAAVAAYESATDGIVMATLFLLLAFHYLQLQATSPGASPSVNPARRQLFLGVALAYAGLFASVSLLLTGFLVALRNYY